MENEKIRIIAKQTDLHPKIVELLIRRGFTSIEDIDLFVNTNINMLNTVLEYDILKNVVKFILDCLTAGYKVIVYADADMDGISSAAIIYRVISSINSHIEVILPEKVFSSYGINFKLFDEKVDNKTLLVFLDVGTSDIIELGRLQKKTGCVIVVIDHHEKLSGENKDIALFNPKCFDIEVLLPLTSASLSLLVAISLLSNIPNEEREIIILELIEFATLGIVADLGKLLGVNRTIVKLGLQSLTNPVVKSLQYLLKNEIKLFNEINIKSLAFKVIPLLNACCRMGYPRYAFDFLIEKNMEKIKKYSQILIQYNESRKVEEQKIFDSIDDNDKNYIVVYNENWHPGILSSVATRIAMNTNKPTVIMTKVEDCWKGSARFPNGNILQILESLSDNLIKFGGHKQACGFEVKPTKFHDFLHKLNNIMDSIKVVECDTAPEIEIELEDIDTNFIKGLKKLEPFGMGNPVPIFKLKRSNIYSIDESEDEITIFLYSNAKILKGVAKKKLKNKLISTNILENVVCKIYYTNFNENFVENEFYLEILDVQ
ncbi:MAG: DHHA1 domain-containing protein [Planctomycetota bacterium]